MEVLEVVSNRNYVALEREIAMEKCDLFDETRQPLNKIHNRRDKMIIGEYHIVVEIWTVNPNFWENTGGSVLSGETSEVGAIRELFEETGIITSENELYFLGTVKEETAFVDTYIIRKDLKISELTMQEGETVKAQWVSLEKLNQMIELGIIALPVSERLSLLRGNLRNFYLINKNWFVKLLRIFQIV